MNTLTITEAFAEYGATRKNSRWAYSAIAQDGSMVLSCWQRYMKALAGGVIRYEVKDFARWSKNPSGKSLLKAHLRQAYRDKLPVRMVLAQTDEVDAEVAGIAGSELSKRFLVRDDLVGSVIEFDTGRFIIDFLTA